MVNFSILLRNVLWMKPFENDCRRDSHYGELAIFFFIWPYRVFVAGSILSWLTLGVTCAYPLFVIWILAFIGWVPDCIYSRSPKWQEWREKQELRSIRESEIKRRVERQRILELHKDDPPKHVTPRF